MKILNQVAETHRVRDLAYLMQPLFDFVIGGDMQMTRVTSTGVRPMCVVKKSFGLRSCDSMPSITFD